MVEEEPELLFQCSGIDKIGRRVDPAVIRTHVNATPAALRRDK